MVDQVPKLLAYDVQLHYNGGGLSASSVDFSGPFAGSSCTLFPVLESKNDATGIIRAAVTTFSGCTVDITGPTPIFVVTFTVVARQNSPLHILTDFEAAGEALVDGSLMAVGHSSTDGFFFAEPNIRFQKTFNVTTTPRQPKISQGMDSVVLSSGLRLERTESLPGFALVVYDIITPTGKPLTVTSNEVFLLPGDSVTVMATFKFGTQTGTYEVFGTLWRGGGANPPAFVPFETLTGQTFRVH